MRASIPIVQLVLLIATSLLLAAAVPGRARACKLGGCVRGYFVPEDGATIPENTPALVWRAPQDYSAASSTPLPELHLRRVDGVEPSEIKFTLMEQSRGLLWIQPEALVAGARYRIEVTGACATPSIEFAVAVSAPKPVELGTVTLSAAQTGDVTVATSTGSCDTQLPGVMVHANVHLSKSAAPWQAMLQYTTRVDGKDWSPSWSLGGDPYGFKGAENLLFAECPNLLAKGHEIDPGASHDGLSPGTHRVQIEAVLAGIDGVLKTPSKDVELSCAASSGCDVTRVRRNSPSSLWALAIGSAWLLRSRRYTR